MRRKFYLICGFMILLSSSPSYAGSYGFPSFLKVYLGNNTDASYIASTPNVAFAASPTDFFEMSGSASKTIYIQQIDVELYNSSGMSGYSALAMINVVRHSTANSGGTSTALTPASLDTNNGASTVASVKYYTANPTSGTVVSTLARAALFGGSYPVGARTIFKADTASQAIVLRGSSDYIALNANGGFLGTNGGSMYYIVNVKYSEQ